MQSDAEIEHQVRLHVLVRLTAAIICNGGGDQRRRPWVARTGVVNFCWRTVRQEGVGGIAHILGAVGGRHCVEAVEVLGQFILRERVGGLAAYLALGVVAIHVQRGSPLQIGQAKIDSAIAAVSSAQQGEKCLILIDRQELSIA